MGRLPLRWRFVNLMKISGGVSMNRFIALILFAAVLSTGAARVCPAGASEGDDAATGAYKLESYRVTARKTEEDVQKVPISATVVTGTLLEDAEISDTGELTRFTPNVYFKKSTSENVISMRGITSFDTSVFSPTAVYVDDVMLPLHYAHLVDLTDIERVEVLRGPQGTLYGGNSLAGVINIVTRQPDDEKRLKLSTGMGAYTGASGTPVQYSVGVNAAGPIAGDRWYLGGSGSWEKGDGYITNLARDDDAAGAVDRKSGRVILRFVPTPRLDFSLTGDLFENDDRISVYRFDSGPFRTDPYTVRHDTDDYQLETGHSQNLRGT
jgi:iron complex outermembrane receptor protein